MARRWRRPSRITRGESRGAANWLHTLVKTCLRVPELRRRIAVQLTDNVCTAAIWARGRARPDDLNSICRLKFGLEALGDIRARAPWVDTKHMPADGGTRADTAHVLQLYSPSWGPPNINLAVGIGGSAWCAEVSHTDPMAPVQFISLRSLTSPKERHRLLSLLSGGRVARVWWGLPYGRSRSAAERLVLTKMLDAVAQGVCACYDYGIPYVMTGLKWEQAWIYLPLIESLTYARNVFIHQSVAILDQANSSSISIRIVGPLEDVRRLKCDALSRPPSVATSGRGTVDSAYASVARRVAASVPD